MSRHLRPIDWDDIDESLQELLYETEDAVMKSDVRWDDLAADAQERFSEVAKRQIEANRQREFDDARIEAHIEAAS